MADFLAELQWRGLLYQSAGQNLEQHLQTPGRVAYCGFDPTANSLTVGNFNAINLLRHWQLCGHKPIVVMGGGTGRIGDPSGKDAERQLLNEDQIDANIASQKKIFERVLDFDPKNPNAAIIVNNYDWLQNIGYVQMLREVGKYFSVNTMIQKDSVKDRLENREQGISYTEFSYMVLQAYDFLHLYREYQCSLQLAGSDQYGNIVAGMDLIRRESNYDKLPAYGVTSPLVTRADGKKFGKSEKGAVWLTADRTSPYAFYQFWINTEDSKVMDYLRRFTLQNQEQCGELEKQHEEAPQRRIAHKVLAEEMTRLLHGEDALRKVEHATSLLFGGGDLREVEPSLLRDMFADVPHSQHDKGILGGEGLALVDLLTDTSLVKSKRQAREYMSSGALSVNGTKVPEDYRLSNNDLLGGDTILLRRGKKQWHATRWG